MSLIMDDPTAEGLLAWLRTEGGADLGHAGGRSLLDHLLGTYWIVRRWGQPQWLRHAALIHSVYGTDSYGRRLLGSEQRAALAGIAGDRAERLAYLFCVTPRRPLLAGTHRWARDMPTRSLGDEHTGGGDRPTRDEVDALVLLHMANLAEQARAADGSPGRWLVRLRDLGDLLLDSDAIAPPLFIAQLATLSEADESFARRRYLEDLSAQREDARASGFSLAAATCPALPEPCVWLSYCSLGRGDTRSSRSWSEQARKRLVALGTSWDKRLTYEQWLAIIEELARSADTRVTGPPQAITDPRALFEAVVSRALPDGSTAGAAATGATAIAPPDASAGRTRFQRYVEALADADRPGSGATYPDLPNRAWHDPSEFPLAGYLESHYAAIRDEVLALAADRFQRESERIGRTGEWDVAFLYERGRRRDAACAACPVTTRAIEAYPTIRTASGLIYISRMRAKTHISPHRGPTNVRVRCHLGIKVPQGDCAISVGGETRRWQEGRCLVFDDSLVHEAWNHTDEDRIVLIADLWHPGLSDTEVMLLESLDTYTYFRAERLSRYWSANAAATHGATTESGTT
jgi:aspartate beta-hydroxylase